MAELLDAALALAADARPVFLLAGNKMPVRNCPGCPDDPGHDKAACGHLTCHGFYAATCDPDRIRRMFAAVPRGMLALRTGSPSGTVVVDVDPAHGGRETLHQLVRAGLLPPTSWVETGSGGLHLYYRHPGQHVPPSQSRLGPGIDVRGDGAYVVAPPSVHPKTGRQYAWQADLGQLTEMPAALVRACQPPAPTVGQAPAVAVGDATGFTRPDRLLETLLDRVRQAPEGQRRTTLYGCARGVAKMVAAGALSASDAVAALTDAGNAAGQSARETRTAITGGFRAEGVIA